LPRVELPLTGPVRRQEVARGKWVHAASHALAIGLIAGGLDGRVHGDDDGGEEPNEDGEERKKRYGTAGSVHSCCWNAVDKGLQGIPLDLV
jgi:hypothetical protein